MRKKEILAPKPTIITAAQALTWCQAAAFFCCGFGSIWLWLPGFGLPVLVLVRLITGDLATAFAFTPFVSLVPSIVYAVLVHRWLARADRRARVATVIGSAVIAVSLAASVVMSLLDGSIRVEITISTAVPSLVIQAIVLRLLFSWEGRRWFTGQASKPVASGPKCGSGRS
ncbi:MAG TPA: hypothetical protein VKZ65_00765 [Glycomyces sp.]|nr:hypothetical protein [Glycomyces sp.]